MEEEDTLAVVRVVLARQLEVLGTIIHNDMRLRVVRAQRMHVRRCTASSSDHNAAHAAAA